MKNKRRGISLIVLIVTIIVIIILAAAVILTLSKNNPVESAREAKFKEDVRSFQDDLALIIAKEYTNAGGQRDNKINASSYDDIKNYIPSFTKEYENKIVISNDNLMFSESEMTENELKWCQDLGVSKKEKTWAQKVAANPSTYYGKKVNYTTGNISIDSDITEWRIFYSDNTNIYLIASNYISVDNLPLKNGRKPQNEYSSYPKAAPFENIISQYNGSSNITDVRLRKLNTDYFLTNNFNSTEYNMKAVAYMLDTSIWNNIVAGNGAEYAIGGPTLEMLVNSYCSVYTEKNYIANATSQTGYKISFNGGTSWSTNGYLGSTISELYNLNLSNAYGFWLSSPSGNGGDYICVCTSYSSIDYSGNGESSNTSIGFLPVICLTSNVILLETADGFDIQ